MSEEQQVSNEPVGNEDTKAVEAPIADASVIAESKKYRKRSQASEARVAELEAKINSIKDDRLKEQNKFQELYEQTKSELDTVKPVAEKWTNYEATERESLLNQVPEDEKADWENSPLNLLKKYVAKSTIKTNNPSHVDNLSRGKTTEFGGYESYPEWAQKDPEGYVQANNTLQGNNIKIGY